jgi:hypothetical protein
MLVDRLVLDSVACMLVLEKRHAFLFNGYWESRKRQVTLHLTSCSRPGSFHIRYPYAAGKQV